MSTINYQEVKKSLLTAIQMSGYAKDGVKSCAAWLVFRNESGDKVVVARKSSYTTFFNPNIPDDKGDIIDFLLHRLNGGAIDTSIAQKGNIDRLQQALSRVAGYTPSDAIATAPAVSLPTAAAASYEVRPFAPVVIPFNVAQLLRIRGISQGLLKQPDMADELGLLRAPNGRLNLFFRWRDLSGSMAGGQYKYINFKTGGTAKYFLAGTSRHRSVWSTSAEGRSGLFVCEDPFDAISYRQLHPEENVALLATGGTITGEQVAIIKSKAAAARIPIILGNDSDLAGQICNLKIVDETAEIISANAKQQVATIRYRGEQKRLTCKELKELVLQQCQQSAGSYRLEAPEGKDWNEDLKKCTAARATPSPTLQAALSSDVAASGQPQPLSCSIRY